MNKTWTGGWAYAILKDVENDKYIIKGGYEFKSTNNRMEVYAIYKALRDIKVIEKKYDIKYRIEVVSDSGYAVFPFMRYGWIKKWNDNLIGEDTKNFDLWKKIFPLVTYYGVRLKFTHIRGHGKNDNEFYNKYNDIVDKYCVNERLKADEIQLEVL